MKSKKGIRHAYLWFGMLAILNSIVTILFAMQYNDPLTRYTMVFSMFVCLAIGIILTIFSTPKRKLNKYIKISLMFFIIAFVMSIIATITYYLPTMQYAWNIMVFAGIMASLFTVTSLVLGITALCQTETKDKETAQDKATDGKKPRKIRV